MAHERKPYFQEFEDSSWIGQFPPGFWQKGKDHVAAHPDEQFTLQVTGDKLIMRRMKKPINGTLPKDSVNGRIITWSRTTVKQV